MFADGIFVKDNVVMLLFKLTEKAFPAEQSIVNTLLEIVGEVFVSNIAPESLITILLFALNDIEYLFDLFNYL